eukprot:1816116-Alexandrium_andersonii.AAC.1
MCSSDEAGQGHEFTTAGTYTCPYHELSPYDYAIPACIHDPCEVTGPTTEAVRQADCRQPSA